MKNNFRVFFCFSWVIMVLIGILGSPIVAAEQVRLKDGTELNAAVVQKDSDSVFLAVPRSDVATVDGKALPDPVASGFAAPEFSVTDVKGKKFRLSENRGKVIIITFWASWCPHCMSDISMLKDISIRYRDKGVEIVAVSIDKDLSKFSMFVKEEELPYTVVSVYDPARSAEQAFLPNLYEAQGVPSYFVIDKKGVIASTFSGSVVEGNRDLEGLIKGLL
jgi:peroxiredoxin